jgi:hypothetical protein
MLHVTVSLVELIAVHSPISTGAEETPPVMIDLYTVSPACIDEFIVLLNTKLIESAILLRLNW